MNIKIKAFLFLSVLLEILILTYSMNRGFDITDEGYYLLSYQNNYQGGTELIKSHEIVTLMSRGNGPDIIEARLMRLTLSLISGIIFALCFFYLLKRLDKEKNSKGDFFTILLITLTGILGSYSINPQAISYNSLTLILSVLITSILLLFMELTLNRGSRFLRVLVLIPAGLLLGTMFFVKFTSAIALFVTASVFVVAVNIKSIRESLLFIAALALSLIGSMVIYAMINVELKNFISGIFNIAVGLVDTQSPSNTRGLLFQALIIGSTLVKLAAALIIGSGLGFIYLRFQKLKDSLMDKKKKLSRLINAGFILFSFLFIFSVFYAEVLDFNNFSLQIFIIVITFFLVLAGESFQFRDFISNQKAILLMLFILVPFSISFGTDVPYMRHLLFSLMFIFCIPFLFYNSYHSNIFSWLFISLSILATIFIFNNNYLNPYRMSRIDKYNVSINNNPVITEKVKFKPDEANDLEKIAGILVQHGYKRGDNLIAAYRIPGLVYLLGGTQPGGMLWGQQVEGLFLKNLGQYSQESLKKTIIITRKPLNEAFINFLGEKGINFPSDYEVFGNLSYGEREINTITVYIPKH